MDPEAIDLAVLQCFLRIGRRRRGARLFLTYIEHRWTQSGFRKVDLLGALERLEAAGCIRCVASVAPGTDVVLLLEGERRLTSIPLKPEAIWRWLRVALQLRWVRSRPAAGAGNSDRRRSL
jgi:hypothetical protein